MGVLVVASPNAPQRTRYAERVTPHPDSAAAAVETLRAELDTGHTALEALDRKAALVPATLGVIAGLFIAPDSKFTDVQQVILAAALVTGIVAVVIALMVLRAQSLGVGPNAKQTAEGTYLAPADFNRAVAGSLAISLDKLSEVAQWKGTWLNRSMWWAAVTILLLAVARVVGGFR